MADPTGLVSLGIGVAKKAFKHGSTIRSRKRYLKELPYAIDLASSILHNAEQSDDPVTRAAHREILGPCISEAREFIRRVENRRLFASNINKFWSASDDDEELKRLLAALGGAPERAHARRVELQKHNDLLVLLERQQRDLRSVHSDVARSLHITILYWSFFGRGETSVTPMPKRMDLHPLCRGIMDVLLAPLSMDSLGLGQVQDSGTIVLYLATCTANDFSGG